MKKVVWSALLVGLLPLGASAGSGLEGTWRYDWPLTFPDSYSRLMLSQGDYICMTCTVPFTIKADGKEHKVKGDGYDSLKVTIDNDRQLSIVKKQAGKVVETFVQTVSQDGSALEGVTYSGNRKIEGRFSASRVGSAEPGAHLLSGLWKTPGYTQSEADSTFNYRFSGTTLDWSRTSGESFSAPVDGTLAPYKGSEEIDQVSVQKLTDRVLLIHLFKGDRFVRQMQVSVSADGQLMSVAMVDGTLTGNIIARKVGAQADADAR